MDVYKNILAMAPKWGTIGINFTQFFLFIVNFVFAIVGTLCVVLAISANWISWRYTIFLPFDYFDPVALFIAAGVILFILAFFGGIATIARSTLIVNIYFLVLLILLIVEINVVITTFIVHGNIHTNVESKMVESLNNQTSMFWLSVLEYWDYMQNQLSCCGIHNSKDWAGLGIDGAEIQTDDGVYTVPYSCCLDYFKNHSVCQPTDGCLWAINPYISDGLVLIGYITLAVVISQVAGLIFAYSLSRNIRRIKTEEEMQRQEIQHLVYADLNKPEEEKPLLTSSSNA